MVGRHTEERAVYNSALDEEMAYLAQEQKKLFQQARAKMLASKALTPDNQPAPPRRGYNTVFAQY